MLLNLLLAGWLFLILGWIMMGIGENNSAVVFFLFAVILFAGNIILAVK